MIWFNRSIERTFKIIGYYKCVFYVVRIVFENKGE